MQAPTSVLIALARLHAADLAFVNALETERDNAQLDYDRLKAIPGGATNDHVAMLLVMADERAFCARKALRAMTQDAAALQPQDLGYDAVVQE
jgi:hypothetical protein